MPILTRLKFALFRKKEPPINTNLLAEIRATEGREWWLWAFAVAVTVGLTLGIVSLTLPESVLFHQNDLFSLREWVRGLAALVLIFDLYTIHQQRQLHGIRRSLIEKDQLFRLISENAADMIALVDRHGNRLYNSPAYTRVLGYSADELNRSSSLEQVHPDDRERVLQAAGTAITGGHGETIEYRMLHKDGSWRTLESTASPIREANGEINRLVIVNRDITQRKHIEEKLVHTTLHDSLTNLPNRALFLDRLQHAIAISKRQPQYTFAVLFIDIDEFKVFNESLGNTLGDQLLIQISQRLASSIRSLDRISRNEDRPSPAMTNDFTFARVAGDEFTVLIDNIRNAADSVRVGERLQQRLAAPFTIAGHEIVVSASIGIAVRPDAETAAEDMLRDAEIAMQRAKRAGKGKCQLFDSGMHASAVARLRLETNLRKAYEHDEFLAYYQPIVSLDNQQIVGFEVLTRWLNEGRIVPPGEFIGVADEIGLTLAMNRNLLREACAQLKRWHAEFPRPKPLFLSMNVAPKQFAEPELAAEVAVILKEYKVNPQDVHLEIVETIAMGEPDRAAKILSELRAVGVELSIDDFGTGYSSLSRLQQLPIDTLKIDKTFIFRMEQESESYEIVRAIATLAHNLGLKVVAEGVETATQVQILKDLGCHLAQGYHYSPPNIENVMTDLLRRDESLAAHGSSRK